MRDGNKSSWRKYTVLILRLMVSLEILPFLRPSRKWSFVMSKSLMVYEVTNAFSRQWISKPVPQCRAHSHLPPAASPTSWTLPISTSTWCKPHSWTVATSQSWVTVKKKSSVTPTALSKWWAYFLSNANTTNLMCSSREKPLNQIQSPSTSSLSTYQRM